MNRISVKLLSFILILLNLCGSTAIHAEQQEYPEEVQRKVTMLSALDILRGYEDGSFQLDSDITRAEFAVLAIRALNLEDASTGATMEAGRFMDVESGYWAEDSIAFAVQTGLMAGSGRFFRPDERITLSEAVKILVSLLGYGDVAEYQGGYPAGYLVVAADNGLLKGISSAGADQPITRADVINLFFNAITVDIAKVYSVGEQNAVRVEEGNTILSEYFHIEEVKGRLIANEDTALFTDIGTGEEGTVKIDDVPYLVGETKAADYLGYRVKGYYREERDQEERTLLYLEKYGNYQEVMIPSEDIVGYSGNRLTYDVGMRTETAELPKTVAFLYNGVAFASYEEENLELNSGNLLLLDYDGDSTYDTVFAQEYYNITVGSISNDTKRLNDLIHSGRFVEFESEEVDDPVYSVWKDGQAINFTDIKAEDVVSVYQSKNKRLIRAEVARNTIQATVTELDFSERKRVKLDDTEYWLAYDCDTEKEVPSTGMKMVAYLNFEGKIASYRCTPVGTRFAYIMKMAQGKGLGDTIQVKVLDSDGKVKPLTAKEKVTVDGVSLSDYSRVEEALTVGGSYQHLVLITTDKDDRITKIQTEKPNQGLTEAQRLEEEFRYDGVSKHDISPFFTTNRVLDNRKYIRFQAPIRSFEGKIGISAETKVFVIPSDDSTDEGFEVKTGSGYDANDYAYEGDIEVYNMDRYQRAMAIIKHVNNIKPGINKGGNLLLVDQLNLCMNADGEDTYMLVGLYGGKTERYVLHEKALAVKDSGKNLARGDLVQIALVDGEVKNIQVILDVNDASLKLSRGSPAQLDEARYLEIGKIYSVSNGYYTFSIDPTVSFENRRAYYTNRGTTYLYDEETDKISIISTAEIEDYLHSGRKQAIAALFLSYQSAKDMVYYRFSSTKNLTN